LSKNLVNWELINPFQVAEKSEKKIGVKDWGIVVLRSVDVAHEEIVVAIGITFHLLEELDCLGHIKLGPGFLRERQDSYIKACILSPFLPGCPIISLNTVFRPIPSVLTLNHAHNSINLQGHSRVSRV
jgi:hypothetical protein